MKIKQLKTQEEKKTTTVNKNQPEGNSSKSKNPPTEPEKTQAHRNSVTGLTQEETKAKYKALKDYGIESAEIVEKTPAEKMEEILKNNDKFETVKVIMELLCKELGLPISASMQEIVKGLQRITEDYYKSMEEWKKMTKKAVNNDIRQ